MNSTCSTNKSGHPCRVKVPKPKKMESDQDVKSQGRIGRRIGYVRVSDEDQSEALQIDALKEAGCVKLYHDHGISGAKKHRPGLENMLADLCEGDTLTVWKLDRLGRSTLHLFTILEELQARRIHFCALTQGIDTRTAIGRMVFGQLAVFAEYERSLISERTKAGMKAAKARGIHVGQPRLSSTAEIALTKLESIERAYDIPEEDLDTLIDQGAFPPVDLDTVLATKR